MNEMGWVIASGFGVTGRLQIHPMVCEPGDPEIVTELGRPEMDE
jgi:hypothetical protein